jgi:hypothetical protein
MRSRREDIGQDLRKSGRRAKEVLKDAAPSCGREAEKLLPKPEGSPQKDLKKF